MVDVVMPTTDGRIVTLPRYVEPKPDLAILLDRLGLTLPAQPRRRSQAKLPTRRNRLCSEDLRAKPQQPLGFCSRTWKVGLRRPKRRRENANEIPLNPLILHTPPHRKCPHTANTQLTHSI